MAETAQLAYEAYGEHTEWKTFDGRAMPSWDELGAQVQGAWRAAAAQAVIDVGFRQAADEDASGKWAEVSGYVDEMVREGSKDAAQILRLMRELMPSTRLFTSDPGVT